MQNFFSEVDRDAQRQANRALSKFNLAPSQEKRRRFQKRMDFYNGIQVEYLKDDLSRVYKDPSRLKLQYEWDNLTEFLINEVAAVYGEPPIRKLVEGSEQDEDIFKTIWEESRIDLVMQEANRMAKLHKTVLVKVVWRDDKIQYDILTPNVFDVIESAEDQTKADAVIYVRIVDSKKDEEYINNDKTTLNEDKFENNDAIFHYWTDTQYIAFRKGKGSTRRAPNAKVERIEDNEGYENPYGVIPCAVIRDGFPKDGFYIEGGDDLIDKNGIINQKLTEKNFLTKMQSFSVPVRKGAKNTGESLIMDPSLTIDIPGDDDISRGNDFRFVTPDAKIEEVKNDIEYKLRSIAIKYKLNPEIFTASAERSSAQSLQLQNAQQSKIIKADKPFYIQAEKDLFEITKIVWNTHNAQKISDNCELLIDYRESETIMTIEERDNHNIVLMNNGLISKADWLMDINPDIRDRDEAMQRLIEIAEQNREIMEAETANNPMMEIEPDGEEQQEPTEENQADNE